MPKANWVKLQLLLHKIYGNLQSVQSIYGSSLIEQEFKINPDWLLALSPNYGDLEYFRKNEDAIKQSYSRIKKYEMVDIEQLRYLGITGKSSQVDF